MHFNNLIETKSDSFLNKSENEDPLHYFVVLELKNNRYNNKFIQGKGSIYFIKGEGPDQIWGKKKILTKSWTAI